MGCIKLFDFLSVYPYLNCKKLTTANPKEAGDRKVILPEEQYSSTNFLTLWDFKGYFEVSPLFYGWYTNIDTNKKGYRLPLAYFITGLVVYAYSFFATLRKMAENSRMSKLSDKDDECIFSWKLFTAWDYMIGNCEAAHNRVASIVMGFKEALLEEAEKKRESRNWKITTARIMVNIVIFGLFSLSAGSVAFLVGRSINSDGQTTFWRRNELTIVMTLISLVFPMLFDAMGFFERYHPRKQLRIQLARIMALNLLNLYSLIISQFHKVHGFSDDMMEYFTNLTTSSSLSSPEKHTLPRAPNLPSDKIVLCYQRCYWNRTSAQKSLMVAALILNSSFLSSENVDKNNSITKVISYSTDVSLLSAANGDYPNYDEYFASDESSSTNFAKELPRSTESLGTSDNNFNFTASYETENSTELKYNFNSNSESDEMAGEIWREKFNDYLTYILSSSQSENSSNLTEAINVQTFQNISTEISTNSTIEDFMFSTEIVTDSDFQINNFTTTNYQTISKETTVLNEFSIISSTVSSDELFSSTTSLNIEEPSTTSHSHSSIPTDSTTNCKMSIDDTQQMVCEWVCEEEAPINMTEVGHLIRKMNNSDRQKLRALCWETMFGQELVKLTIMDLIMTFLSTIALDFFRGIFVRVMNSCWCWDLEKMFPKYSDFKVAENILHLVNNQGMIWMGLFFSPGLGVINVVKLFVLMYLRAWTVLTCNVPPEVIFRASKSNNFYYALLLMMLFLCVLPVGYAMACVKPSWYCGPFSGYKRIYDILIETIIKNTPKPFHKALAYIASPGSIIPLLVLLILFIYYLTSLASSLREANAELKLQLRRERTEERRKMFKMVHRRKRVGSSGSGDPTNPFYKWKKLLGNLPTAKSQEDPASLQNTDSANHGRDFLAKLIKKALHKSSTSEDGIQIQDEASDTEQLDSLPHDMNRNNNADSDTTVLKRRTRSSTSNNMRKFVTTATTNNNRTSEDFPQIEVKSMERTEQIDFHQSIARTQSGGFADSFSSTHEVNRQESVSSNWSDNIPVITISKTESSECILNSSPTRNIVKEEGSHKIFDVDHSQVSTSSEVKRSKFMPRIKYALKKQTTEIDEESIRHFHKDIMKQRSQTLVHDIYTEETNQVD